MVSIVLWNSASTLARCLQHLRAQTYRDFRLYVVDNASSDGGGDLVREAWPEACVLDNSSNQGYSQAHNQVVRLSQKAAFLMPLNPDAYLSPTYLERLVDAMDRHPTVGIAVGKLYSDESATVLDGAGLSVSAARRQYLRGNGAADCGQYDRLEYVFGADGSAPLYRMAMLTDIAVAGEYLDEDLFAHKEDFDLSWRAQLLGWRCLYVPDATAQHQRFFRPGRRMSVPPEVKRRAVRNRYLVMLKNDRPMLLLRNLLPVLWYDLRVFAYLLLYERSSLPGLVEALRMVPRFLCKRREVMQKKRVTDRYMATWFKEGRK